MPTLTWKRDALKALMAMQPKRAASIRDKCREIAAVPRPVKHSNLISLAGVPNGYRVRFGDWRVSFTIDPDTDVMEVFEVAARGGRLQMVHCIEGEITAIQADFAHTITWLRGDYLPSPLPKVVEDRLATLVSRFDALRELVEDREAAAAFARTRDQESVPDSVVARLLDGEHPVRVWRQHRGLSLRSLAEQAGTSPSALSDIETGKSEGRLSILHRIAGALNVGLEDLVAAAGRDQRTITE